MMSTKSSKGIREGGGNQSEIHLDNLAIMRYFNAREMSIGRRNRANMGLKEARIELSAKSKGIKEMAYLKAVSFH